MTEKLYVLTAVVAKSMVEKAAAVWNAQYPEMPCEITGGGSVALIRKVRAGVPCDVLISADDAIIDSMMIPEYADAYQIFAGNKMVITSLHGKPISTENWKETILDPEITFGYSDPTIDPGGYRAEMAILLADEAEQGLTEKLMNHPGRKIFPDANGTDADYKIYYYTKAILSGNPYAELPDVMNMSDPALNDIYAKAVIELGDGNVAGSSINHALTIPKTAQNKEAAEEFIKIFLAQDFAAEGFLPR